MANIEYFKDGEMLCADSVIQNDLIVTDAYRLNISMSFLEQGIIEGSDKDISDLFYKYCKRLK